jgi:hypothetical protein
VATVKRLTDAQWAEVLQLRCKSKRGERLTKSELQLVDRAKRAVEDRYGDMARDVFNLTVPFGSNVRIP